MVDAKELEVFSYDEPGYKPQVDYDGWRVALLNSPKMYLPQNVTYFDRHLLTDEVFILLAGSVGILTAGRGEIPKDTVITWLEEGKAYNVKKDTWHTLYMMPNSKLAIIENKDTCIDNSPRYYFSSVEGRLLLPTVSLENN